jgi:hypothetical protein
MLIAELHISEESERCAQRYKFVLAEYINSLCQKLNKSTNLSNYSKIKTHLWKMESKFMS